MDDLSRKNNALNLNTDTVNGRTADIHITTHGSNLYFAISAAMGLSGFIFLGLAYTKPRRARLFHYITAAIVFVACIAYFTMGSNLGFTPIEVEFPRTRTVVRGGYREIFYVRYIDWFITTPLLLTDLMLTAGMPWPKIAWVVLVDWFMIVLGLVGALVASRYKWAYFSVGCFALFYILYELLYTARRHASRLGSDIHRAFISCSMLTIVLWILYPISWGVCEGGNYIAPDSEAIFYSTLDFIAKPFFGALLLWGHRNIDPARLGVQIRDYNEDPAYYAGLHGMAPQDDREKVLLPGAPGAGAPGGARTGEQVRNDDTAVAIGAGVGAVGEAVQEKMKEEKLRNSAHTDDDHRNDSHREDTHREADIHHQPSAPKTPPLKDTTGIPPTWAQVAATPPATSPATQRPDFLSGSKPTTAIPPGPATITKEPPKPSPSPRLSAFPPPPGAPSIDFTPGTKPPKKTSTPSGPATATGTAAVGFPHDPIPVAKAPPDFPPGSHENRQSKGKSAVPIDFPPGSKPSSPAPAPATGSGVRAGVAGAGAGKTATPVPIPTDMPPTSARIAMPILPTPESPSPASSISNKNEWKRVTAMPTGLPFPFPFPHSPSSPPKAGPSGTSSRSGTPGTPKEKQKEKEPLKKPSAIPIPSKIPTTASAAPAPETPTKRSSSPRKGAASGTPRTGTVPSGIATVVTPTPQNKQKRTSHEATRSSHIPVPVGSPTSPRGPNVPRIEVESPGKVERELGENGGGGREGVKGRKVDSGVGGVGETGELGKIGEMGEGEGLEGGEGGADKGTVNEEAVVMGPVG